MAGGNRRLGIAFNRDDRTAFVEYELPATNAAVRANRTGDGCICVARLQPEGAEPIPLRLSKADSGSDVHSSVRKSATTGK